jgi:hypothetical protein
MDLSKIEIWEKVSEAEIFKMKPGDKFLLKTKKRERDLSLFAHMRYMKDGSMVRIMRIDSDTLLVCL